MKIHGLLIAIAALISLTMTINAEVDGSDPRIETSDHMITYSTFHEVRQYGSFMVISVLKENLSLDNVTITTNIVEGIHDLPSIDDQVRFGNLDPRTIFDLSNRTMAIEFDVSDQMIWFDGERMLDNITVTIAISCYHNGTLDLDTVSVNLIDVNDPPEIDGAISIRPDIIRVGDEVIFSIPGVMDPDMDEITLSWRIDGTDIGSDYEIGWETSSPGEYAIALIASDGNLKDERRMTFEVLPAPVEREDEPEPEKEAESSQWFIIAIGVLVVIIISVLIMAIRLKFKEEEVQKRHLWSFNPMNGPSRYEKDNIDTRLKGMANGIEKRKDPEERMEEDFDKWSSTWILLTDF